MEEEEEEVQVMFSCDLCEKKYAYLHKLHHHELWLCKGRASEAVILNSPRRSQSRNYTVLPPTPDKCDQDVELAEVEAEAEAERGCKEDGVSVEEEFYCDQCEKGFHSKNARKKHKKKYHRQHHQEVGRPKLRLFKHLLFHGIFRWTWVVAICRMKKMLLALPLEGSPNRR